MPGTTSQTDHEHMKEAAERAGRELRDLIDDLTTGQGLPAPAVLAGIHTEIVITLAQIYGGKIVIDRMVRLADSIEGFPSASEFVLSNTKPAGTA